MIRTISAIEARQRSWPTLSRNSRCSSVSMEKTMKLGASTIPFKQNPLTRTTLENFKAAGIESLELSDFHPNFSFEDADFRAFL
ncbi:MAG: hypothetical protein QGH62_06450, partial [Nitrospinaceae bacterium]|nr:hypothetical protein [Nitrospinaceae bacterium]